MLTPLQRFRTASPAPFQEAKAITAPAPSVDSELQGTAPGMATIFRARYTDESSYTGKVVATRIERASSTASSRVGPSKTLPGRHGGDVVRPGAAKKHTSRRAADAR